MKLKLLSPFIILFALCGLLAYELYYAKPHELPSALIGQALPNFKLPSLNRKNAYLETKDLRGKVSLLNVWASWCSACQYEQPMLLKIREQYHVTIYGIDYKDNAEDANQWLQTHGNPYAQVGSDQRGDVAIDLGVYGTPETFVINPEGKIIYRHIGVITQADWDEVLYPLIKHYENTL